MQSFQILSFAVMIDFSRNDMWLDFKTIPFTVYVAINALLLIAVCCLYLGIFRVRQFRIAESRLFTTIIHFVAVKCVYIDWVAFAAISVARTICHCSNHLHQWSRRNVGHTKTDQFRCCFSRENTPNRPLSRPMDMFVFPNHFILCSQEIENNRNSLRSICYRCLVICAGATGLLFHNNARIQKTSNIRSPFDAFDPGNIECGSRTICRHLAVDFSFLATTKMPPDEEDPIKILIV